MKNEPNVTRLIEHIQSSVYEGMLKLGYNPTETISIYYDLDLLNYLLEQNLSTNEEALALLESIFFEFPPHKEQKEDTSKVLQPLAQISIQKNRFRFKVPKEQLSKIYHSGESNTFLRDMITLVASHHFTLSDVKAVFEKQTSNYTCEEIKNNEFQYVLYFNDSSINQYNYCFSFDEFGGYYHRLLDYDYKKIMNEH